MDDKYTMCRKALSLTSGFISFTLLFA